jgi:hypothetical protein
MKFLKLALFGAALASGATVAAAAEFEVYAQSEAETWQKIDLPPDYQSEESLARGAAERQCIPRVTSNIAAKYVNLETGEETVFDCVDGNPQLRN